MRPSGGFGPTGAAAAAFPAAPPPERSGCWLGGGSLGAVWPLRPPPLSKEAPRPPALAWLSAEPFGAAGQALALKGPPAGASGAFPIGGGRGRGGWLQNRPGRLGRLPTGSPQAPCPPSGGPFGCLVQPFGFGQLPPSCPEAAPGSRRPHSGCLPRRSRLLAEGSSVTRPAPLACNSCAPGRPPPLLPLPRRRLALAEPPAAKALA